MSAPVLNVNSDSYFIRRFWLERMKIIPPFNAAVKVARTNAKPTQPEHLPFLAGYFLSESAGPLGDPNTGEPRFHLTLKLGFSWIVKNDDPEAAEDKLDEAHWAFMKMLHDPDWHIIVPPDPAIPNSGIRIESILGFEHERYYGTVGKNNEMPIAEMRMEMEFFHSSVFDPIISDTFQVFHSTILPYPAMDPAEVEAIILELNLPQD
jgi:hypothetical protein